MYPIYHILTAYSVAPLLGIGGTILVAILLVAFCVAGLSFNLWLHKNGKFPDTHIRDNKHMRRLGITCVVQDEAARAGKQPDDAQAGDGCSGCTAVCAWKKPPADPHAPHDADEQPRHAR
ncbi:MAG: hypothetical protein LBF90_00595 [Prevotellaceae bacterium]|nr:hypothetical protein [Prevotellaceae bacterium]